MTPTEAAVCLAVAVLFALVAYLAVDRACRPRCPWCASKNTRRLCAVGQYESWRCRRCRSDWDMRQE